VFDKYKVKRISGKKRERKEGGKKERKKEMCLCNGRNEREEMKSFQLSLTQKDKGAAAQDR
jgi:hypothetical protein